jgi:hypothetical protein
MKTSEALTSVAQALLRSRGADKIAPDLGTISRAVRECAPLVKADASDQTSVIIELALHYIRTRAVDGHAVAA